MARKSLQLLGRLPGISSEHMHTLTERADSPTRFMQLLWLTQSFLWHALLLALCLLALPLKAEEPASKAEKEFSELVRMAPLVVKGQPLSLSIFARNRSDRHYGEKFAEEVIQVASETITSSTGKGLVIIGAKGEPHPIHIYRKFVALAAAGRLDPQIAALAPELSAEMKRWEAILDHDEKGHGDQKGSVDFDYERIVSALPIPLKGLSAKLYQLAWEEKFEDARVEARLCALRKEDLERRELFKRYDWAFYLPPKGAFNKVIDDLISEALKEEEIGFFTRVVIKGALLAVKPKIRRAIEGFRQGMLFMTLLEARTTYSPEQIRNLTDAFVSPSIPNEKTEEGPDHDRRVHAIQARLTKDNLPVLP
jgi:hypothetical protein